MSTPKEVTIVELPPQKVLGMRKRGRYEIIPTMLMTTIQFAMEKGVTIAGPPIFVMHECSSEDAIKADHDATADIEIAWPITGKAPETDEIKCYTLPGGKMAKIIHKGPYQESASSYEVLMSWIAMNGKRITGPLREVYPNDPREVRPEEILTEIYAPIA